MEDEFSNKFAKFYAEHEDTYGDDLELALDDFKGFESMESEYGLLSNATSAIGSGLKTAGNAIASGAKQAGNAIASGAKTVSNATGLTSLAQGAKRAAYGAAVGGTVNAIRGKSIAQGATVGAGVGVVGGGLVNKAAQGAGNLYNKVKQNFSDMSYSELVENEDAVAFAKFYEETEDIYQDNMDEAFNDYLQLYSEIEE